MHNASYWKGVRNTFMLLFGVGLLVLTYLTWNADLLQIFGGHVQVPCLIEPVRWLAITAFGMSGGVMIFFFLDESYDFDFRFYRKADTVVV
jgi:hypothetical protein